MSIEKKTTEIASLTAKEAGKKIKPLFGKVSTVKEKEDFADLYSEADLLAEKIISAYLNKEFPQFNYLSEEKEYLDRGSEYTWIIDPLDGSIPFIAGLDYWGVSIGLLKDNKPVSGVIYIPSKDWLFRAYRGGGSFLNGKKVKVSKKRELEKAIVGFDVGNAGYRREGLIKNVASQIDNVRYMPSFACSTFGQVLVAKGIYDAYLHHRAFPWDFCAGTIIVQEAGGKVTDHEGLDLDWTKRDNLSLLASNGLIHEKILKIINSPK